MPHPDKGETESGYISRCVSNEEMKRKFPDKKQRLAVCYSYWKKDHPHKKEEKDE